MDDIRVERFRLKDGRYGETKVKEVRDANECGRSEVVYEHFEEEPRQLQLRQRVVEKTKPVVYERVLESVKDNVVVERKVESCDPTVQMQLREHLGLIQDEPPKTDPCYATVEDLKQAMLAVAEAVKDSKTTVSPRVRMQDVVQSDVNQKDKILTWVEYVLLGVIGVEAAWIAFHIVPQIVSRFWS